MNTFDEAEAATRAQIDHEFREVESPLPWRIDRDDKHPGIRDAQNNMVAALISIRGEDRVMADANAELIVRAVNAFEATLAALRVVEAYGIYPGNVAKAVAEAIAKADGLS